MKINVSEVSSSNVDYHSYFCIGLSFARILFLVRFPFVSIRMAGVVVLRRDQYDELMT